MIEIIQTNILDNTNNQNLLTLKTTNFCNFMERVTNENLIEFYNGKKICRINPIDGDDEIYVFVTKVGDDIAVKKSNLLYDCFNKISGLKQEEIFKEHFYLYTNPCDLIDKKIEWYNKQIKHQEELREIYKNY